MEKVTLFRADDGTLHDTAEQADQHDTKRQLSEGAKAFADQRISGRTVSKNKAIELFAEYALGVVDNGPHWPISNYFDPEVEDNGGEDAGS